MKLRILIEEQQHQFSPPRPSQRPAQPATAVQQPQTPQLNLPRAPAPPPVPKRQISPSAAQIAPQPSTSGTPPVRAALPIPRTTALRKRAAAANPAKGQEGQKPKRKYERSTTSNMCDHCRIPKTKEFGQSRHVGDSGTDTYCPTVQRKDGKTVQQWPAERKQANPKTKK